MLPQTQSDHTVDLDQIIAPAFHSVHDDICDGIYTSYWLKGGRGSTKSSFVAVQIILGIVEFPDANAVCLRKVAATIKDSLLPTFEWVIDKLNIRPYFRINKSDQEITYLPTGQKILLRGLDDPQKMKSIKAKKGYFRYLWFEEAAEFTDLEEMESVTQSVLRGGKKFIEFVSYNPPAEPFAWINEEARADKPKRLVHASNYRLVPPDWLGPKFLADAADMEKNRPEKFAHVYMGVEVGRTDAIVFSGCYTVEEFIPSNDWDGPYFGADWGYSQDPTVLIKCWINGRKLYIEYEAYGKPELDEIPHLFDQIPDSRRFKIRADCARPETISHVKSKNFNIEAAEKWPGSIEDGIAVMKSFDIIVHPRCVEFIKEMRKYSYKIDRLTRDVLTDMIDKFNHGIDACRYALAPIIRKKNGWFM